jgi:hypothetical protein
MGRVSEIRTELATVLQHGNAGVGAALQVYTSD